MPRITEYPEVLEVEPTSEFIIGTRTGTAKIQASDMIDQLTKVAVYEEPKEVVGPTDTILLQTAEGDVVALAASEALTSLEALETAVPAATHRGLFRGKDLGTSVTDDQWTAIRNGTFDDLWTGDYWTINGAVYRIADFDYWLNTGDQAFTSHHLVMVPDKIMYNQRFNATNTTVGGYAGSEMFKTGLNAAKTTITNAFGSAHVLSHRNFFTTTVTDGRPSARSWFDSTVDLMNEHMVYGSKIYGTASTGTTTPDNRIIDHHQLALFRLAPEFINMTERGTVNWGRDIISGAKFVHHSVHGLVDFAGANPSDERGVRPAFAIG